MQFRPKAWAENCPFHIRNSFIGVSHSEVYMLLNLSCRCLILVSVGSVFWHCMWRCCNLHYRGCEEILL